MTPWSTDTAALLAAGPLTHTATAWVETQDGDLLELPLIGGTLTFDEGASPRVEATLTTHLVPDPALNARIDPRAATRILLSLGYIRPDGATDLQPVADLGLRSKTRARPADELTLTAYSDEAAVIEASPSATLTVSAATTLEAITDLIALVLPSATVTVTATTAGPAVALTAEPDVDKWTALVDYADRVGANVYDDGTRHWHVVNRPNAYTTPVHRLADGPAGTLVDVAETNDRDDGFGNRVQLVYEWRDSADVDHRIVAYANATGVHAPTTGNTRIIDLRRDTPTTQAAADLAAANLVARTVTRGRRFEVTAPAAYWVRPGHTVTITETGLDPEHHLVTAVSFDLRTGLMQLTTRQPD